MSNANETDRLQAACAGCGYDMTGLTHGGVARCPECGLVGPPATPHADEASVTRGVLTALGVGPSALLVLMGAGQMFLAFNMDWGVDEARAMALWGLGIAALALATAVAACFTASKRFGVARLVLAGVHAIIGVTCAVIASGVLGNNGGLSEWAGSIMLLVYNCISIAALVGPEDWRRLRGKRGVP